MSASRTLCQLMLLLLAILSAPAVNAAPSKLPIIHIDARATVPLEIGLDVGRKTKALFSNIEQRYDQHLATLLSRAAFEDIVRNQLPKLMETLDKSYQDEIRGIAGTWAFANKSIPGDGELSLDEYRILNLLPDLGFSPDGSGFGVFQQAAVDQSPIVGRNLDGYNTEHLLSLHVITAYHFSDISIVTIGFAGMLSVLSGFNSEGLFVSVLNAAPYNPYQKQPKQHTRPNSSAFDLRQLLETRASTKQASQFLSSRHYGFDINILLADKQVVKVLEYPTKNPAKLRAWDSSTHRGQRWQKQDQIAVVDCFALLTSPDNCKAPKEIVRWKQFQQLAIFKPTLLADTQNISTLMFDKSNLRYEIFSQQTTQSMIYTPENGSLHLYTVDHTGKHPKKPVHQVYLGLLPAREKQFSLLTIDFKWLVWSLLATLLGVLVWQLRRA